MIDTIPFSLISNQRGTGTTDRRMVNIISETIRNPLTQEAYYSTIKRPGLPVWRTPASSSTGRGVFSWAKTGMIYSVSGAQLVASTAGGSTTLASFTTSSGRVWFDTTPETGTQVALFSDGTTTWAVNTANAVTTINAAFDADYPTGHLGPTWFFSNYIVNAKNGQVVNSNINAFSSYTSSDVISQAAKGDGLEAIWPMKDQLVCFGKNSIEFLFDNGNPSGSPFLPIDQNRLAFGLASKESLAWAGDMCMFVGENSGYGDGGRSVWMMQAGSVKEVSDSVINRFLAAEGSSISSCSAWIERVGGQLLYVLNLSSADRTFVYNVNEGRWDGEWEDANGGNKFNIAYTTSLNGTIYGQDPSTGIIYTLSPTTYQDASTNFTVTLQTEGRDRGTSNRKSDEYIELIADTQTSGTATLSASDDDFSSFSNIGTFDLTKEKKIIHRGGSYKGKRAYRVTYTGNTAFRAKMLRVSYKPSVI